MARILIVEDDPMQREQYALYLRSEEGGSHEVDEAKSATEAVGLTTKKTYDLILLDIMLAYEPEDDANAEIDDFEVDYGRKLGVYVYRKVRALPNPPPIALVSVIDDYGTLSEFPKAVGHLPKYFSLNDLGDMVSKWLSVGGEQERN